LTRWPLLLLGTTAGFFLLLVWSVLSGHAAGATTLPTSGTQRGAGALSGEVATAQPEVGQPSQQLVGALGTPSPAGPGAQATPLPLVPPPPGGAGLSIGAIPATARATPLPGAFGAAAGIVKDIGAALGAPAGLQLPTSGRSSSLDGAAGPSVVGAQPGPAVGPSPRLTPGGHPSVARDGPGDQGSVRPPAVPARSPTTPERVPAPGGPTGTPPSSSDTGGPSPFAGGSAPHLLPPSGLLFPALASAGALLLARRSRRLLLDLRFSPPG
jgi:hypothetical protein